MNAERVIFPEGPSERITEEEATEREQPYRCQQELYALLDGWKAQAESVLRAQGYHDEQGSGRRWWNYRLEEIPDPDARAARWVADLSKRVRSAISRGKDNPYLLALEAVQLGLYVASAHALEFEMPARVGQEYREQQRNKGRQEKLDPLGEEIKKIVNQHQGITASELRERLRKRAGEGHVISLSPTHIRVSKNGSDEGAKDYPLSGLASRLSRAKNKLQKAKKT